MDISPYYIPPDHSNSTAAASANVARYYFQRPGTLKTWTVTHTRPVYNGFGATFDNTYYLYYNQDGDDPVNHHYKSSISLRTTYSVITGGAIGVSSSETTISPNITVSAGDYIVVTYNTTWSISQNIWTKITFTFDSST